MVTKKAHAARRARAELRDAILEARAAGLTLPQMLALTSSVGRAVWAHE